MNYVRCKRAFACVYYFCVMMLKFVSALLFQDTNLVAREDPVGPPPLFIDKVRSESDFEFDIHVKQQATLTCLITRRKPWEPVDPVVADPVRQDNDKRNNIQIYTEIPY